ncbi:kelch repeat-containing protein [Sphingobacterium oryzagri]|uniref:Kelch repeat-containing protein n=1 Tax=Sphingobacterium oryzagri TaxID=3025669 RepID=A0ABY7WN42_9SPHI|nr:kelch repeat-containing protein [Sphingobacterium sp. KACC 22765]WDF70440.1 kelch repeat-containing protein [Sphingobacterium sp. KACC 22765]
MRANRTLYFLFSLFILGSLLLVPTDLFGQGIRFTGSSQPIEKRTSANFFSEAAFTFTDRFALDFDLQVPNNSSMGYIVRIKEENQRSIINLHYEKEGGQAVFRLNEEGKANLITLRIPLQQLIEQHWFPVRIAYDLRKGHVELQIARKAPQLARVPLSSPYAANVTFGRSDYMIDVPSFSLRNFRIGNNERETVFPLRESKGDKLHNAAGEVMGKVANGTWLLNDAYHWHKHTQMRSSSTSGATYDAKTKSIYYFNRDSLAIYEVQTGLERHIRFAEACPVEIKLGTCFIVPEEHRLYVYETHYTTPYAGPTVASLDLEDFSWRIESSQYLQRELNHHAAAYLANSRQLLLFAGYGNMVYSNDMLLYNLEDKTWSKVPMRGDSIFPRYFTSSGRSPIDQKLYIFGGMGNESGQHIVGRKYFYDLYSFDPRTRKTSKLWDVERKDSHFVPARGLVIPDSNWIYMLGYPEHLTHSFIKLRRFALKDGRHETLGDSIPIYSDRISTHANLYFDPNLHKLVVLVQESDDDVRSTLTVYSLDFPAISAAELDAFPGAVSRGIPKLGFYLAGIALLCLGASFFYIRYRRPLPADPAEALPEAPSSPALPAAAPQPATNCIFLFGDFTVLDRRGLDISHLFSTRLQQVFCLLLFHSTHTGISSNLLTHLLWPDKPKDKAKTSRGVAINNLRKVLCELDGVEIIYDEGHYRMVFQSSCSCDYWRLQQLLADGTSILHPKILTILQRGEFLLGMDDPIFDKWKHDTESRLIDRFQQQLAQSRAEKDWSTLFRAAEALVMIDAINELAFEQGLYALHKEKQEARARLFYKRFSENYRRLMGEEYRGNFEELWSRLVQF